MYTKEQKEKLEKVMEVFGDYMKESPYVEVVWSEKIGYIFLNVDKKHQDVDFIMLQANSLQRIHRYSVPPWQMQAILP